MHIENSMEIRRIQKTDIDGFLKLWSSIYDEGEFLFRKPPPKESVQRMVSKVEEFEIPNYIAISENQVVGAAEVFPASLFGLDVPNADKLGILGILVDYQYRGTGLSRKLMDKLIEGSIRFGFYGIELDVCKSNQRAINLYEHYRFKWVSDGGEVVFPSGAVTQLQKMYLVLNA